MLESCAVRGDRLGITTPGMSTASDNAVNRSPGAGCRTFDGWAFYEFPCSAVASGASHACRVDATPVVGEG